MADLIQFSCPACSATLRLPLSLASQQGPCPCCSQEIIAPNPEGDIVAKVFQPAPVEPIEKFIPFAEPPPPALIEPAPELRAPSGTAAPIQPASSSSRAVLVLSILLSSVLSLALGYILGTRSNWIISCTPLIKVETPINKPPASPQIPPPIFPEPELSPQPINAPASKVSDAAEVALKAFLDAPDWASRSTYVLNPIAARPAMEAYSHDFPDGPTPYLSIAVADSQTDQDTGNTRFFYNLFTTQHPYGFPVTVTETSTGWLVDWQKFVEFRDDHFKAFCDGPVGQSSHFHLYVKTPSEPRASKTENIHFASFLIHPALPDREEIAYVRKDSKIYRTLSAATADGNVFTPVIEITKRSTPDRKSFLEITSILATHWRPDED